MQYPFKCLSKSSALKATQEFDTRKIESAKLHSKHSFVFWQILFSFGNYYFLFINNDVGKHVYVR